jgi:DNA-binding FadR family transcriptional regulator
MSGTVALTGGAGERLFQALGQPPSAELARSLPTRMEAADLEALAALADEMRTRAGWGVAFWQVDGRFHRRLVASSGNLLALTLVDLYWNVKASLYESGFPLQERASAAALAAAHVAVVTALRDGDGELAARRLSTHHEEAERRFHGWVASHAGDGGASAVGGEAYRAAVQMALLLPPGVSGVTGDG